MTQGAAPSFEGQHAESKTGRGQHAWARIESAWARTDRILQLVRHPEQARTPFGSGLPVLFHVGHLASVAARLMGGSVPVDPELDDLFARPATQVGASLDRRWPRRELVEAHRDGVRGALRAQLQPDHGARLGAGVLRDLLDHEASHQEQVLATLLFLPGAEKGPGLEHHRPSFSTAAVRRVQQIGACTLPPGLVGEQACSVSTFGLDSIAVMNGEFFEFVDSGAYDDPRFWSREAWNWRQTEGVLHPRSWRRSGRAWLLRGVFEDLPLERVFDWPVSVSLPEALAWLRWRGGRLPTEAQFLAAAGGASPADQAQDWPAALGANVDLEHWSPTPVGALSGASHDGVHDLLGSGWEWCLDADGQGVLRGGSWATARCRVRPDVCRRVDVHSPLLLTKFRSCHAD